MTLTPEQLKARKQGLGGSDAAAALGLSKWRTPLEVYFDKTTPEVADQNTSDRQEWGNRLEPVIVQKFQDETGLVVELRNEMIWHPEHKFMFANIDGFIPSENAVLECKTADAHIAKTWGAGIDDIPPQYLIQCAHYAEVLNVEKVYIAVLIGGNQFRIYVYNRNPKLATNLIKREKAFWENHVLAKVPPEPSNISDVALLYPTATQGECKVASDELIAKLDVLKELKQTYKSNDERIKSAQTEVLSFMQDAELLTSPAGETLATWKTQETTRLDINALRADHPEIYNKYTKTTQSRVFRIKGD